MPQESVEQCVHPVKIPEASLDFVLIGPHEKEQRVLAQSPNPGLLLLGAARVPSHLIAAGDTELAKEEWLRHPDVKRITGLYENDPHATLYSMTSYVQFKPNGRGEPVTFAWVGRSPNANLEPVMAYFKNCVSELYSSSMGSSPESSLRWHLAPLLLLCAKHTKTTREREQNEEQRLSERWEALERENDRTRWIANLFFFASLFILFVGTIVSWFKK